MKKKQIAILSTMYYPIMGAPSACIDKYVQSLKDEYDFHIITRDDTLKETNCPQYIHFFTSKIHELRKIFEDNIKRGKWLMLSKLGMVILNLIKLFQTQFFFPTAQHWEVEGYYKELQRLHIKENLDVIIPVSNNFVTQLATLKFKRKYPGVKWIAFITDPYSEFYVYYKYKLIKKFWKRLNLKKEQEIYNEMDYGLFTAEMYKYVPMAFNVDCSRIHKIEFALNEYPSIEDTFIKKNETCKLIYAGLFYKEIRNPEYCLATLSQIPDITLDMYVGKGECEDIISKYNQSNFNRSEYVNRQRYLEMIYNEYDILVNVGNNASLQAPSKMLELLSTGKPIINFYHSKDSQFEMIEKYPLGINVGKGDVDAVVKVTEFCKKNKGKSISFEDVQRLFPDNNLQAQVRLLKDLIES